MARYKGKFCKPSKAERLKRLAKAREARWTEKHSSEPSCSAPIADIPFPYVDHAYNPLDVQPVVSQQEEVQSADVDELGWRCGRRIVALGVLADGLKACQLCGHPLHLIDCVGEKKFGLAHILMVKCSYLECGLVNDVPTGSRHKTTNRASACDVNTKLAAGMINGGFGESHVNGLLSSLNIPTITQSTLKTREREITPHLHKMAEDSCNKHLREEISMSDGDLIAGFDGAWQKGEQGMHPLLVTKPRSVLEFRLWGNAVEYVNMQKRKVFLQENITVPQLVWVGQIDGASNGMRDAPGHQRQRAQGADFGYGQ